MITVESLSKTFTVHRKDPGLLGSIKSLVRRKKILKHAVRNVTFQVGEGEIVGLLGANGAGKTTVVKMLAGIIHPTAGDARVLGYRPWERDNRMRRQIALIMGQKAQLWWDLPAADCFLLLREIYRMPEEEYNASLRALTDALGIGDQMNIQIRRLSLGERMKMELIAALLHQPRVVFLDEPTIGLDLNAQRAIRDFIISYQQRHSPAMILTSHYMEDIERLCKRIIILRDGEVVYDGSLEQVVRTYATRKIITAHFREDAANTGSSDFSQLGTVLELTPETVRLQVKRARIAEAAAHLVNSFPVKDLIIEEEDVGAIISKIMTQQEAIDKTP